MKTVKLLIAVVALVAVLGGTTPVAASAEAAPKQAAPSAPLPVVPFDGTYEYGSSVTLVSPDGTVTTARHTSDKNTSKVTPRATPPGTGPQGAVLHCNKAYNFSDSAGTYTIQHGCGTTSAPWSFKFSGVLCATSYNGQALEKYGMGFTVNNGPIIIQKGHTTNCLDYYHGTLNAKDYDHIAYQDYFTWRTSPDATRDSVLQIYGSYILVGSPCSPTSC